jgi:hypothetical protein
VLAAASCLYVLLAAPSTASASVTVTWQFAGSTLRVTDAADEATSINISYRVNGAGTGDNFLRIEAAAGVDADLATEPFCIEVDATTVDCYHYIVGPPFDLLDVRAGNADDTITIDRATMTPANLSTTSIDLRGEEGNDVIQGSDLGDIIYGGDGNDDLYGYGGDDVIYGDAGADELFGGDGADGLDGGGGNDQFRPGVDGDVDTLAGGETDENLAAGGDIVMLGDAPAGVTVTLADGLANDGPDAENYDASIESVEGSLHDDVLTLGPGGGTAYGSDGADTLVGSAANDVLWGEDGNDDLDGLGGSDTYIAGGGDDILRAALDGAVDTFNAGESGEVGGDTITYAGSAVGVSVTMNAGAANDGAGADAETVDDTIENVTGTSHADTIVGDGNANALRGGDGNDTLDARDGVVDTLIDCGDGASDIGRVDTIAAGGVDDPASVGCESINPVVTEPAPTPPLSAEPEPQVEPPAAAVAARLAGTSARVVRARCSRAQQRTGVRDGARRWCYRIVVRSVLRRVDTGAVIAGQRVSVHRVVAGRAVLVQRVNTSAAGVASVSRAIVVPVRHRASVAAAQRWLAQQFRTTRVSHVGSGSVTSARPVTLRTKQPMPAATKG